MALFAPDPHLTANVTHDERFLQHVEKGWQADLTNFVQNGVPKILFALLLAFIFQTIVNFFIQAASTSAPTPWSATPSAPASSAPWPPSSAPRPIGIVGFYVLTQILAALGVSLGPPSSPPPASSASASPSAPSPSSRTCSPASSSSSKTSIPSATPIKIAGLQGSVEDLSLRVTRSATATVPSTSSPTPRSPPSPTSPATSPSAPSTSQSTPAKTPTASCPSSATLADQVRKEVAFKDIVIADPDILGVDKITGYEVIYPMNVRVQVNQRDGVMRELRRRVLKAFNKEGISLATTTSTLMVESHEFDAPDDSNSAPPQPASNQPSPSASSPNVTK